MAHVHTPARIEVMHDQPGPKVYVWFCAVCKEPMYEADPAYVEAMELAKREAEDG